MLGKKLSDLDLKQKVISHFGVKEAVFPFNMFPEVDPVLGPEMRSTGEVLGLADSFGMAFFKSQEIGSLSLPLEGTVLITVSDKEKPSVIESARLFMEMGFRILATEGTHKFLAKYGIDSEKILRLGHGRPNIVDAIKNGEIQLVINTPSGRMAKEDDSYIRKAAIKHKVLTITTTAASLAASKGIASRKKGHAQVKSLQNYHADIK
jgi:carbamoyl-phosphate synthase large subunit